ncbi:altered inheritance of mitochondria protein 21 [Podospora didyma]|uniref:Altered inheritance of mitochondria protein 21 n=1 Tax=Podospora didyma TaxID=330526 RepID=A0AAE0NHJ6_9PEZI|nr:altered inheritance of mitochondria protein 21 [Podospora didyma]
MSATAAQQQPPAIPPRPSRAQEKAASIPMVPPRPANRRIERSLSPNPSRFAPSPLNDSPLAKSPPRARNGHNGNYADRSAPVDLPSLGEEGREYAGLAEELNAAHERASSPEHTRIIGDDVKLHAPKPSLPAASAKQRVMTVTRTDSDRAASFGIGRPSSNEDSAAALPSGRSLKKKASTTSQLSTSESFIDDEHGIPEIGKQVPMYPNAGDVQAPSPAPGSNGGEGLKPKHHSRKTSARGGALPPGSYGLHGHGLVPQDKLERAYFEKHPDLLKKEHTPHHHDRPNDFSMSSDDLNRIVRDTAARGSGLAVKNYAGTPSDQIGWQAIESTSRVASPHPTEVKSPRKAASSVSGSEKDVIHVEEPSRRKSVMFSDGESPNVEEEDYKAPILAEDELAKDPAPYDHQPAVEPQPERRGSAFEIDEPTSRPTSRPASLYKETSFDMRSTPLEDVEEYEPLFVEEEKAKQATVEEKKAKEKKQRFPSADIWEDAPSSVHYTAEVSTPDLYDEQEKPATSILPPARDGETPAQAFARHQEELAEKETAEHGPEAFLPMRGKQKPLWAAHQSHLASETRPSLGQRFPSRDVWEDTPDSLKLETTVSTPQRENDHSPIDAKSPVDAKPEIPVRSPAKSPEIAEKPAVPQRPKTLSGDDSKPAPSARPKPNIPTRPVKAGPTSGGLEPAETAAPPRAKPAVPARPMGSKIAALQAGFMSDLNNRLRLGPQAPKKEEPAEEEQPAEEKEKAPLVDARKSRARGPQRRAPVQSASPAPASVAKSEEPVKFVFAPALTVFEVDPDEGVLIAKLTTNIEDAKGEAQKPEDSASAVHAPSTDEEQVEEKEAGESETEAATEEKDDVEAPQETKSLATNMAGETVVEEQIKRGETEGVEPTKVEEH